MLALSAAIGPALAADYGDDYSDSLRPSYPDNWDQGDDKSLGFEAGLRYWYSAGEDKWNLAGSDYNSTDKTSSGELALRIDDYTTNSYVKGLAGYSMAIDGDATSPFGGYDVNGGHIGYAGADFGWSPFGGTGNGSGIYGLVGYHYWNESPDMGRANFTTAESSADVNWPAGAATPGVPGDSEPNNINIHALRLGFSGKAQINEFIDVSGEIAAVPYAWVNGTFGAFGTPITGASGVNFSQQGSAATVDGTGYGAMGELMVGFHPTDNMVVRLGGRAWYLQGRTNSTFSRVNVTQAGGFSKQNYISSNNPFSLFRYGLLAEMSYKF
jgi:hypothetical protein